MTVLVDTSVWSQALRRSPKARSPSATTQLATLIGEGRASIIGPIRQELLSGVKDVAQFGLLRDRLRAFEDLELDSGDYEDAADLSNRCRTKGIQGSAIDFLICAVAARRRLAIFTLDNDFRHFSTVLDIELYAPRS
jgi:predicted nucleic acid-binding protein